MKLKQIIEWHRRQAEKYDWLCTSDVKSMHMKMADSIEKALTELNHLPLIKEK